VALYDLRYRYREDIIEEDHWQEATQVEGEPTPAAPGDMETFTVTGLDRETKYVFALKTADEEMNVSTLSNSVVAQTLWVVDDNWWGGFAPYPDGQGISGPSRRSGAWRMLVYNDALVVGGSFSRAGNLETRNIAQWDGSSWSPLGTGVDGAVGRLITYDGDLIVAGGFEEAGGIAANSIARWDGSSWSSLGFELEGGVSSLAVYDGDLYTAGEFRYPDLSDASNLWRWDGRDWHPVEAPPVGPSTIAAYGEHLYAGGSGTEFESDTLVTRLFAARWDQAHWEVILSSEANGSWLTPGVSRMATYGQYLIVRGDLLPVGDGHLAMWDGSSWHPLPWGVGAWDPKLSSGVTAFGEYRGNLVAGGNFWRDESCSLAWLDGSLWKSFGSGIQGRHPRCYGGHVGAIAEFQGKLYVSGAFTFAGGKFSSNIARWDE
jgi:hypothetical protein